MLDLVLLGAVSLGGSSFVGLITRQLFKYKFAERNSCEIDDLQSGDILLFCHNTSRFNNNIIGLEFTHMGMIYRDKNTGILYIIELTTSGDYYKSKGTPGIYEFHERYARYNGYFCVRKCKHPEYFDDVREITEELIRQDDIEFDYEFALEYLKNVMMPGVFDKFKRNKVSGKYRLCCSDFVYILLVMCKIIEFDEIDYGHSFYYITYGDINGMYEDEILDIEDSQFSRSIIEDTNDMY